MRNWDNDPSVYPYDDVASDDDAWFHPVTYDRTVYPDAEADPALHEYPALNDAAMPDLPAYREPGLDAAPGLGLDRARASSRAGSPAPEPPDGYAGYEDFQSSLAGQAEASWQQRSRPADSRPRRVRRGPRRRIAAGGRPPWRVVGVTVLAAAALGFGVVIVTGRVNHSLPSSALPGGTAVRPLRRPALRRPALPAGPGPARPGRPAASSRPPRRRSPRRRPSRYSPRTPRRTTRRTRRPASPCWPPSRPAAAWRSTRGSIR